MKKANNFQIGKNQPQGVAQLLNDIRQIQSGVVYKSFTYKKKRVVKEENVSFYW